MLVVKVIQVKRHLAILKLKVDITVEDLDIKQPVYMQPEVEEQHILQQNQGYYQLYQIH